MGRKKISIEYISNKVNRKATFKARIGGLIKKLQDLTVLCGVQASLVVTDTDSNLVAYSNSQQIQLLLQDGFNRQKKDFKVKVFTLDDVRRFLLNFTGFFIDLDCIIESFTYNLVILMSVFLRQLRCIFTPLGYFYEFI